MAKKSVEKGKRFERLLASKFREYGYDAKHVERLNIYDAMDQAKRDAEAGGKGLLPAVFHKKNNHNILVTMEFDTFMEIYREFEAGRGNDEKIT